MSNFDYKPPEFWNFKPLFTIQPVAITRDKQLRLWRQLILDYCITTNSHKLIPSDFPYFNNKAIERQLSSDSVNYVINSLIKAGNAEWEDSEKTSLRIIWKTSDQLAGEVYSWAVSNELIDTVLTLYELHSGDEYQDSGFHSCDPVILRRALEILENCSKCIIISGSTPDEDGVKFLSVTK